MVDRESGRKGVGCFGYGCLGCAGVIILMMAAGSMAGGLFFADERRVSEEHPRSDHELPEGFELLLLPEATESGGRVDSKNEYAVGPEGTGRVVLDFTGGFLDVVPGEPGEPIRIEGDYDSDQFVLKTGFQIADDDSWVYGLSFDSTVNRPRFTDQENRITLTLPPNVPFVLSGEVSFVDSRSGRHGASRIELGGLSVIAVDLKLGTGGHEIAFSEPLLTPMEHFRIEGAIGETRILELGNASPGSIYISHRIGALTVDLRGVWIRDANDEDVDIDIRTGIGESTVRVPETAAIRLDDSSWILGEFDSSILSDLPQPGAEGLPTLNVTVRHRIGEMSFRR